MFTLENGAKIVVVPSKIAAPPAGADGVLIHNPTHTRWQWHAEIEDVKAFIAKKGWQAARARSAESWKDAFRFRAEQIKGGHIINGLRSAQLGALHAIGSYWSLHRQPATVVMPTGTGKTEAMIAACVAYGAEPLLIGVPSRVLRDQTAAKFETLGLLRMLEVLGGEARNPVVGMITSRPKTIADLALFKECNVIVSTMSSIGQGTAADLVPQIADRIDTLFVDEAHHVPADSWDAFRAKFDNRRVVQFTATPFRRDGRLVDGTVIFDYPLKTAQQDGYFKPITFEPVFEIDDEDGDKAIAKAAVERLKKDLKTGLNHLVMARCSDIACAKAIHGLYKKTAAEFSPELVHSEETDSGPALKRLREGKSRVVVCVDMLGEGFDLPQLKIAAIHGTHKSLAVLLQFTGRFTRSAAKSIGDATVIANIANVSVSSALNRLYSEDADWNHLLQEFSSDAIKQHMALLEFLRRSKPIEDDESNEESREISQHLLRPKFSSVVFQVERFAPKKFFKAMPDTIAVQRAWLHEDNNTLFFVTRAQPRLQWTRSQDLHDTHWDLFVLHYEPQQKLLYIYSSDKSSTWENLAKAVSGASATLVVGDAVFRTLGKINRLQFQSVGLRKHGRKNLSYALYTGADVATALGISETTGSQKANLSGGGWEGGGPVTIGCSLKGRVWSREQGTVPEFLAWSKKIGAKLLDDKIVTSDILKNVLIPKLVDSVPDVLVLSIDWPIEMNNQPEERIVLSADGHELPVSMFSIEHSDVDADKKGFTFRVAADEVAEELRLTLASDSKFAVTHAAGKKLKLRLGRFEGALADYFSAYPPIVRFVDMSELDGNLLVSPNEQVAPLLPPERFEVWDWAGTDLTKESTWDGATERKDSIQSRAAGHYQKGGFEVVFDDDSAGEAADLICMKEEADRIRLALVHCKFTSPKPGRRVKDVVEVCSQAVRSSKWKWRFRELCRHISQRDRRLKKDFRPTRFLSGSVKQVNGILSMNRFKPLHAEIVIVQPGLKRDAVTPDQSAVLAATYSFLNKTINAAFDVGCSE